MKDIFIDNNIAKNFTYPVDPHYKSLIGWLIKHNPAIPENSAHLVVSNKLIREYLASSRNAAKGTSIPSIIDLLTREGRLIKKSNNEIDTFKRKYFTKHMESDRGLRSNHEDRNHIPLVLLSVRKYALTIDDNFLYDITHFPGFTVSAAKRPEALPYDS